MMEDCHYTDVFSSKFPGESERFDRDVAGIRDGNTSLWVDSLYTPSSTAVIPI